MPILEVYNALNLGITIVKHGYRLVKKITNNKNTKDNNNDNPISDPEEWVIEDYPM